MSSKTIEAYKKASKDLDAALASVASTKREPISPEMMGKVIESIIAGLPLLKWSVSRDSEKNAVSARVDGPTKMFTVSLYTHRDRLVCTLMPFHGLRPVDGISKTFDDPTASAALAWIEATANKMRLSYLLQLMKFALITNELSLVSTKRPKK